MKNGSKKKLQRCPNCGHVPLRHETITDRFEYRIDDNEAITVEAQNVPVEVCPHCGEQFFGPAAARLQHAAVCQALGLLTPQEIQTIRERFGPTQTEFGRLTGIGEATISRWERGRLLPSRALDRYLRLLAANPANVSSLKAMVNGIRSDLPTQIRPARVDEQPSGNE
jgi:putative zinc finger/helix-turn-helix YgiT family protein